MSTIQPGKRALATAVAGVFAASGLMFTAPVAHAAAPGTTTATLTVRSGTSSSTTALTSIPSGTTISLQCQVKGQAVQGTYNSDWWAKVTYGGKTGYVSRAYVKVTDATGLGTCSTPPKPTKPPVSVVDGQISRTEVITRAKFWVNKKVPYSMSKYTGDPQGRSYRTDCSGMVSMALHLGQSYSTVTLPERVTKINKADLKPGDIVGNLGPGTGGAAGHVMIFNGWTDASKTKFNTLEETPPNATAKVRTWGSHPYTSHAYRYTKITG